MINNGSSYNVMDIHLLSQIILYHLLDEQGGNEEYGIKYLKNYNLCIGDLEKLIKMNKLNDKYKKLYKSRHKTHFTKLYGQNKQREIYQLTYNSDINSKGFNLGQITQKKSHKSKKAGEDDDNIETDSDQSFDSNLSDLEQNLDEEHTVKIQNIKKSLQKKPKQKLQLKNIGIHKNLI